MNRKIKVIKRKPVSNVKDIKIKITLDADRPIQKINSLNRSLEKTISLLKKVSIASHDTTIFKVDALDAMDFEKRFGPSILKVIDKAERKGIRPRLR